MFDRLSVFGWWMVAAVLKLIFMKVCESEHVRRRFEVESRPCMGAYISIGYIFVGIGWWWGVFECFLCCLLSVCVLYMCVVCVWAGTTIQS